jgi:hypothetical protein
MKQEVEQMSRLDIGKPNYGKRLVSLICHKMLHQLPPSLSL